MLILRLDDGFSTFVGLEPAPYVRIHGRWLCVGPNDERVAEHRDRQWVRGKFHHVTLSIDESIQICFETPGDPVLSFGPFEKLRLTDGIMRAGSANRMLAHFDEASETWLVFDKKLSMANVMITPGGERCDQHKSLETTAAAD
jgi:hypothetical protein